MLPAGSSRSTGALAAARVLVAVAATCVLTALAAAAAPAAVVIFGASVGIVTSCASVVAGAASPAADTAVFATPLHAVLQAPPTEEHACEEHACEEHASSARATAAASAGGPPSAATATLFRASVTSSVQSHHSLPHVSRQNLRISPLGGAEAAASVVAAAESPPLGSTQATLEASLECVGNSALTAAGPATAATAAPAAVAAAAGAAGAAGGGGGAASERTFTMSAPMERTVPRIAAGA